MTDFSPLFTALRDSVLLESEITTNALGNPIHTTEQGIENFWKWFGDSVMKNRKGQPCVFYHGSPFIFDRFIPQKIIGQLNGDDAVFFSTKKQFSVDFATERYDDNEGIEVNIIPNSTKANDVQVYECYLRCKKPFNFKNKQCINKFMEYIDEIVPDQEQRYNNNSDIKIKSFLTGSYPHNYIDGIDNIKIGDIISYDSPLKSGQKIGSIENDVIPNTVEYTKKWNNNVVVFNKGEKSLLAYGIEILKNTEKQFKLTNEVLINTTNTEIVDRIKLSNTPLKGFNEKRIPFIIDVGLDHAKVLVNIVVHRIASNENIAPLHKYPNNWEEIETLLIKNDLSFVQVIKKLGYDSFFTLEKGSLNIVVFNANDIKSVNNDGTFSESDKILS